MVEQQDVQQQQQEVVGQQATSSSHSLTDVVKVLTDLTQQLASNHKELFDQNTRILSSVNGGFKPTITSFHSTPVQNAPSSSPIVSSKPAVQQVKTTADMKELVELKKLIPEFGDSQVQEADSYMRKLQYYYTQYIVPDPLFLQAIGTQLTGSVLEWFIAQTFNSVSSFFEGFSKEYCKPAQSRQFNLYRIQKEPTKTLEAFSRRVKQACISAEVTSEWQIIGHFVQGLPLWLKKYMYENQTFETLSACVQFFSTMLSVNQTVRNSASTTQRESANKDARKPNAPWNGKKGGREEKAGNNKNSSAVTSEQQDSEEYETVSFAPSCGLLECADEEDTATLDATYDVSNTDVSWLQQRNIQDNQPMVQGQLGVSLGDQQYSFEQNPLSQDVLAAQKKGKENPKAMLSNKSNALPYREYDVFQQLNHTRANISVLELLFQEPFRSQMSQALADRSQNLDSFKGNYNRSQQDRYFNNQIKEFQESQEYQMRQQQFNIHLQVMQQQNAQQGNSQQQQGNVQQQGDSSQESTQIRQPERMQTRSMTQQQPNQNFIYESPVEDVLGLSKQNATEMYKTYVKQNDIEPDFSKIQNVTGNINKYIVLIRISDKIAAVQIDSGSHYSVITYETVQKYNLQRYMQPSTQKYCTASGEQVTFKGVLPKLNIQVGAININVTLQVTDAQNYTMLLGQDVLRLLKGNIITSVGVFHFYDTNNHVHFLPMYTDYQHIPKNVFYYLNSFQGLPRRASVGKK